ncbi:hypothetical protein CR970_00390 [Candidatus Saccharibacteria bacterium]|nr:MAG: hypothetical protein CR970_00390 [Candidatus Saccharibacteria bacterium]
MDWTNRGNRQAPNNVPGMAAPQQQPAPQVPDRPAPAPATSAKTPDPKDGQDTNKVMRIVSVGLIFLATALLLALLASIILGGGKKTAGQDKYVETKQMQAVFLNGGQVYFGKISDINDKYIRMNEIYYLRQVQQVQPNNSPGVGQDISLIKLGCELHAPSDQMIINQDQVIFWENLKSDGQVAKAVERFKADNPDGQKCQSAPQNAATEPAATTEESATGN